MPKKIMKLYLCGVDYQHELGECEAVVFESVERLKHHPRFTCWKQCGIVEIEIAIRKVKWIEEQNFSKKIRKRKILKEKQKKGRKDHNS